jgi:acyl carrier protein phosphodiesterase
MNYLAHLLLSDAADLPLAGGVLGDFVRGPVGDRFPPELGCSIRLHRRIDTVTDAHPAVIAACAAFPDHSRRYAGVLLDMILDHCLARDWPRYDDRELTQFVTQSCRSIREHASWFGIAGAYTPRPFLFGRLLLSYRKESGIDWALQRIAQRSKQPERMIEASRDWREQIPAASALLPELMGELRHTAVSFAATERSVA